MRAFASRVEVQRVLLASFGFWLLVGLAYGDPLWEIVLGAGGATLWALLLGWSLTLHARWARLTRVGVGVALAGGCAAALGASAPAAVGVALGVGCLLSACEHVMRGRAAATCAAAEPR